MKVDIWFPFYVSDYISDTMDLSATEHGIYLLLMIHSWKKGTVPKDAEKLKKITKIEEDKIGLVFGVLHEYFEEHDDFYINKRLNEERIKAEAKRARASENGKLGGRPRVGTMEKKKFDRDWYEMILFFENKCLCCEEQFPDDMMPTIDHIIPKSFGGKMEIKNVQPLCFKCNREKSNNHTIDYRLSHIEKIPENLRTKWFSEGKIIETLTLLKEKQKTTPSNSSSSSSSSSSSHSSSSSNKSSTPNSHPKKDKPSKHRYGEYQHALLTDDQYSKLLKDYGEIALNDMIVSLDEYLQMHKTKSYSDHNLTLRNWARREGRKIVTESKPAEAASNIEMEIKKYKEFLKDPLWPDKAKEEFKIKIKEMEANLHG